MFFFTQNWFQNFYIYELVIQNQGLIFGQTFLLNFITYSTTLYTHFLYFLCDLQSEF